MYEFDPIFGRQIYPLVVDKDKPVEEEISRFLKDREMFEEGEEVWIECDPVQSHDNSEIIIIKWQPDKQSFKFFNGKELYYTDVKDRFVDYVYLDIMSPDHKQLVIGYGG